MGKHPQTITKHQNIQMETTNPNALNFNFDDQKIESNYYQNLNYNNAADFNYNK